MSLHETLDRRSRRSRRLILDALLALMLEKRFDRITVQEIIDRADVGRSTFYAHYRSKDDVLVSSVSEMLAELQEQLLASETSPTRQLLPSLGLFRHAAKMQPIHQALVRAGGVEMIHATLRRHLREHAERRLDTLMRNGGTLDIPPEIVADHLSSALLNLLIWWLKRGRPYPPEQMDAYFQQLTMPGVQSVLHEPGNQAGNHGTARELL